VADVIDFAICAGQRVTADDDDKVTALPIQGLSTGTPAHLSVELFKLMTGVNMSHVPYRGFGAYAH
jgi:tripartite-type tricarboxylate transporter receptor subunit TctC